LKTPQNYYKAYINHPTTPKSLTKQQNPKTKIELVMHFLTCLKRKTTSNELLSRREVHSHKNIFLVGLWPINNLIIY
jgi:hypothetical protein